MRRPRFIQAGEKASPPAPQRGCYDVRVFNAGLDGGRLAASRGKYMGYPKDGRQGFDALKYRNTVPCHEIDHRAVPRGEDPPPASAWQRHLAATGRRRDAASARQAVLPQADLKRLLDS